MNEASLGGPVLPETGERGRLFLAVTVSCLLHAAVLSLTFGDRDRTLPPFARSAGAAPVVITARLMEASAKSAPIRPRDESSAVSVGNTRPDTIGEPKAEEAIPPAEAPGLLPLPGPVYYTADQLTKRPRAIAVAELDTAATRRYIVSGKLILQLWIDAGGKVVDVVVEESGLPGVFAETAREAFLNSRFAPGERDGMPVGSLMRIEVSYDDMRLPKQ